MDIEESTVDLLFSTPIYRTTLDICESKLNYLCKCLDDNYEFNFDGCGALSVNQNILLEPEFFDIKTKIEHHLNFYLFDILKIEDFPICHTCSWVNVFKGGQSCPMHQHSNSLFSGVFYLKSSEQTEGKLQFHKHWGYNTLNTETIQMNHYEWNIFNSKLWSYQPKSGDLFIFPSHLNHAVSECKSDRYSLAFNYFVEGDLGTNTNKLRLKVF
jgi:uncharacterized protein (TIGR02466 family)